MSELTPELIAEGYVSWPGGENPCRPDYMVPIVQRDGERLANHVAETWIWHHSSQSGDIIAYKPEHNIFLVPAEQARLRDLLPPGDPLRVRLGEREETVDQVRLEQAFAAGAIWADSHPPEHAKQAAIDYAANVVLAKGAVR